jgi:ribonuclease HI
MSDFVLLKKFNITLHPPKAPVIKEVFWNPPSPCWIKCNTDGSANNNTSACAGLFRNSQADFVLCFEENVGTGNAFHAELSGAMRAIEIAAANSWSNLWLELDSSLVVNAFHNNSAIPWSLQNRWENCIYLLGSMNFIVSHIYKEGNQCADALANFGLSPKSTHLLEPYSSLHPNFLC